MLPLNLLVCWTTSMLPWSTVVTTHICYSMSSVCHQLVLHYLTALELLAHVALS